uniref:Uncharacterized protein n=1 Tax=Plectus sambesii TaxID=2011161 RepID=A0A914UYH3_9BILA
MAAMREESLEATEPIDEDVDGGPIGVRKAKILWGDKAGRRALGSCGSLPLQSYHNTLSYRPSRQPIFEKANLNFAMFCDPSVTAFQAHLKLSDGKTEKETLLLAYGMFKSTADAK